MYIVIVLLCLVVLQQLYFFRNHLIRVKHPRPKHLDNKRKHHTNFKYLVKP